MKKYLLLTSCIFYLMVGYGQTNVYHPFPKKNAIWTNRYGTANSSSTGIDWELPISYCMEKGDTAINSIIYSKVNYCGGVYHGALRDNKGRIYYIPKDSLNELLIYDFTLKTGDSVSVYCLHAGKVYPFREYKYEHVWVDSILIKGVYRKRIGLGGYKWIEGIGNTKGLFVESFANVSGWATQLVCMSDHDTTLFPSFSVGPCSLAVGTYEIANDAGIQLFPNPTAGKFEIQLQGASALEIEIQNILGETLIRQLVQANVDLDISAFPAGIYLLKVINEQKNVFIKKIIKE